MKETIDRWTCAWCGRVEETPAREPEKLPPGWKSVTVNVDPSPSDHSLFRPRGLRVYVCSKSCSTAALEAAESAGWAYAKAWDSLHPRRAKHPQDKPIVGDRARKESVYDDIR